MGQRLCIGGGVNPTDILWRSTRSSRKTPRKNNQTRLVSGTNDPLRGNETPFLEYFYNVALNIIEIAFFNFGTIAGEPTFA